VNLNDDRQVAKIMAAETRDVFMDESFDFRERSAGPNVE